MSPSLRPDPEAPYAKDAAATVRSFLADHQLASDLRVPIADAPLEAIIRRIFAGHPNPSTEQVAWVASFVLSFSVITRTLGALASEEGRTTAQTLADCFAVLERDGVTF